MRYTPYCFLLYLLLATGSLLVPGCEAVDKATGVNNARVGQSLQQNNGSLTRKELALRLRRLAMSYLGDVPEVCEKIAASELPLDKRLIALQIRANSADSIITIAADPDPQVAMLNMLTVMTLHRMLAEQRGEELFGELGEDYALATRRMEQETWKLADLVLDDEEEKELRSLILQYRTDNPDELYVWWVRFSEFSGYKEQFSVASIGRGVVDLFLPVGDAVAGIETTTDVAERATWLAARQSQIVQWRVELTYLQTLAAPETMRILDDVQRISETIENLPKDIAKEREAILSTVEDQEGVLNQLIQKSRSIVEEVREVAKEANGIVSGVDKIIEKSDTAIENINQTIQQAEASIETSKAILPETESALAQLESTSDSLGETISVLDGFTRQFESEEDEKKEPGRPFDIREYTEAAAQAARTAAELNALVTNLDQSVQPERLEKTLDTFEAQVSSLIWQGAFALLAVGLVLILAGKLVLRRSKA
ncbi:MAG: hypothetical protein AAF711_01910 [Planctomycetota bacterium]